MKESFASRLIQRGCSVDTVDAKTGNSTLQRAAMKPSEAAAIFLLQQGADANHRNHCGETALHMASRHNLPRLAQVLLTMGADPNYQTNVIRLPGSQDHQIATLKDGSEGFSPRISQPSSTPNSPLVSQRSIDSHLGLTSPTALSALNALNAVSLVTSGETSGFVPHPSQQEMETHSVTGRASSQMEACQSS